MTLSFWLAYLLPAAALLYLCSHLVHGALSEKSAPKSTIFGNGVDAEKGDSLRSLSIDPREDFELEKRAFLSKVGCC